MPVGLLATFEAERARLRRGGSDELAEDRRIDDIVRMYDDRASYRVTDVSSVVIRDAAVHMFSEHMFRTSSRKQSAEFLRSLKLERTVTTQAYFSEYLERVQWGDPVVGASAS